MKSVSAVIPVYNRFDYLGECLDSVFGQTRVPDQVLVVDDCSTVSVADYLAKTPYQNRVTVISTDRNRGVSGARNRGWRFATSDLIVFLDSDDIWEPYKTEMQVRYLEEHPEAAGVYGAMMAFFPDGTLRPWAHDRPPQVTAANALVDCNISMQTLMIRRDVLEQVGGLDESFGILDDQDIAIRLAENGAVVPFLENPPVTRLRRNDQNHSSKARLYFQEDLLINRRHGALMDRLYGPGSRRVHLARALTRFGRKVKHGGLPSRLLAWLLVLSAPHSRMPSSGSTPGIAEG